MPGFVQYYDITLYSSFGGLHPPEPIVLEEDEAEQEQQMYLEKQRKLKQKQLFKDWGKSVNIQFKLFLSLLTMLEYNCGQRFYPVQ